MEEKIRILIEGDHMEKMPFIFDAMNRKACLSGREELVLSALFVVA